MSNKPKDFGPLTVFPDIGTPVGALKIAPASWLSYPFTVPLVAAVFGTAEEQRHRANLFAAAPDLLAVVERIALHFEGTDAPLGIAARAAIAKAKGETP